MYIIELSLTTLSHDVRSISWSHNTRSGLVERVANCLKLSSFVAFATIIRWPDAKVPLETRGWVDLDPGRPGDGRDFSSKEVWHFSECS